MHHGQQWEQLSTHAPQAIFWNAVLVPPDQEPNDPTFIFKIMESLTVAKQPSDKTYKPNNINRDVEYTFYCTLS